MSIRDQNGRVLVGAPLSDWQYNVIGDGRDWAIVYDREGGGSRAIETAADPHDLVDRVMMYQRGNPEMPVRIMRRSGEIFRIPQEEKTEIPTVGGLKNHAWTGEI